MFRRYQRALSTLGCPAADLPEALALAERHGLDAIEIRTLAGTRDLPDYFARVFGSPANFAAALARSRIRVTALDTSLSLVGSASESREQFAQFVPWADAATIPRLRVFDGGKNADEAEIAAAAETVGWWREERARRRWNADIMVETHDSLLTAERILRFSAAAPGTAILWDSHHTWRSGGEDPTMTWPRIRHLVPHIHVKDSVGRPSGKLPFTTVPPGEGEFPIACLRKLLQADFSGLVSLEWEKYWNPELPDLEVALSSAARHQWW